MRPACVHILSTGFTPGGMAAATTILGMAPLFGDASFRRYFRLTLEDGADPARVATRLQGTLGPGVRVQTPEQRRQDAELRWPDA